MKKYFPLVAILVVIALCCGVTLLTAQAIRSADYSKIPFASFFLGGSAKDLGVSYTEQDYTNVMQRTGTSIFSTCDQSLATKCNSESATYIGTKKVDTVLTNSEGTALINKWILVSKNAPFSKAQMRVNADGSVEFSGSVSTTRLQNFVVASKIPSDVTSKVNPYIANLGKEFPIYAKGTLSIKNNVVSSNFQSISVGIITVPDSVYKDYSSEINSFIGDRLKVVNGLSIEELSFSEGKTTFKGTIPEKIVFPQ